MAPNPFKARCRADGAYVSGIPVHATGADIAENASGQFTFAAPMTLVRIVKASTCTARFRIAINQAECIVDQSDATENVWEEDLPASERRLTLQDVPMGSLAIHSTSAVVYGEDFVVYGLQ